MKKRIISERTKIVDWGWREIIPVCREGHPNQAQSPSMERKVHAPGFTGRQAETKAGFLAAVGKREECGRWSSQLQKAEVGGGGGTENWGSAG